MVTVARFAGTSTPSSTENTLAVSSWPTAEMIPSAARQAASARVMRWNKVLTVQFSATSSMLTEKAFTIVSIAYLLS